MSTYVTATNAPPDFRRAAPEAMDAASPPTHSPIEWTDSQQRCVRAAVDRIIPPDDFPSAWDAGVGHYMLRQLNGDLRHLADEFLSGLDLMNQEAITRFGSGVADLSAANQDELLHKLEKNDVAISWTTSPRHLFAMLLHLTHEGYYADPGNGGNRDELGWRMIGYEHRPLGKPPVEAT